LRVHPSYERGVIKEEGTVLREKRSEDPGSDLHAMFFSVTVDDAQKKKGRGRKRGAPGGTTKVGVLDQGRAKGRA